MKRKGLQLSGKISKCSHTYQSIQLSHSRAGWLNYVFNDTELHRFHYSAKVEEAKNFGVVLAIWDIVFGTFYYQKD